jgi:3D-(3,5/4)-trihydroxycyclohexane-1,2-dione acylhydrolase (decyclizing)
VNRLPLLMFSGDYFAHRAVDPVLQQVETFRDPTVSICDAFKPVVRYWDRISRPEQIIRSLPQALAMMTDPGDCGPAFFALPQDVQAESYDYPEDFFALRYHYFRRPSPDRRDVAEAVALLAGAKKPLILAGGGVRYSLANEQVADFAERRGIPIAETAAGKATVTGDHPNNVGTLGIIGSSSANAAAEDADVIVAIGTRLQDFTTGSWTIFKNPDARFILINTNRWDAFKRTDCSVIGDAAESIRLIDEALGDYAAPPEWLGRAQQHAAAWEGYLASWDDRTDLDPPSYGQVIRAFNALATPDDYIMSAAGGIIGEMTMAWSSRAADTFDCEWGFSTMGYEVAGAWGASMARTQERAAGGEVITFMGDGSYLMANSDVFSTVLTGHKAIFVICDNAGYAVINRLQVNTGGAEFNNLYSSSRRVTDTTVDLLQHVTSMGAAGERVASIAEIPAALARARASATSYALVIPVQQYTWLENTGAWWEVGVPEVSERAEVRVVRGEHEAEKKHQRISG